MMIIYGEMEIMKQTIMIYILELA